MGAFERRPAGSLVKTYSIRISPYVMNRAEDYARKNAQGIGLAVETLLIKGLERETTKYDAYKQVQAQA